MTPRKVAMVSEHASPLAMPGSHPDAGGQNVYVAALAQAVAKLGCDVVVYTRRTSGEEPKRVRMAPGVTVELVDAGPAEPIFRDDLFPYMPEFAGNLRRAWASERPDVVHSHFWMSGWAALEAAEPLGIPVVHTFHALGIVKRRHQGRKDTSPPARLGVEREIVRRVDRIVATCTDEVFELLRIGARIGSISIVPCGVNLENFRTDGPADPRRPDVHRAVVHSRLVERKGIGNTIEAMALVPGCELVIAGGPSGGDVFSDPEARRLRGLAESLGISDRVEFRGFIPRDRVASLLRSADVSVCVPWYEPFGISPVEAMACGVPVIASAVGGLTDTVVDGITGVHVPPRDPVALAGAVRTLLSDGEARQRMGDAGAARARARYAWQRVASSMLEVYSEVKRSVPSMVAEARR